METIDFEYRIVAGVYNVYPISLLAIETYTQNSNLHGWMFAHEFKAFKQQARKAGYTLRKITKKKNSITDKQLIEGLSK